MINASSYIRHLVNLLTIIMLVFFSLAGSGQISPGDLAEPHAHLEGMSNCTECHTLGEKVSNSKCLDCHKLLSTRISSNSGFHASSEVAGKECIACHSDHHGRKFEMIRFDKTEFNHELTGYTLEGKHNINDCEKCHKAENIVDSEAAKKDYTYLGLSQKCVSCHIDKHENTLGNNCLSCHDYNGFVPAVKFNHNNTNFKLKGKHQDVKCSKCHDQVLLNGNSITNYSSVQHSSCVDCHKDVHDNKFGNDCKRCHTENSFKQIISASTFNHSLTGYELTGKHTFVDCKKCHKTNLTASIKHDRCTDCHDDFHKGQLTKNGIPRDCKECHSTNGFAGSFFTIEMHNESNFKLRGSHLATPCFVCHKKPEGYQFRNIGLKCVDCHDNIHKDEIDLKYYPDQSCLSCHNETRWANIMFDHNLTGYKLEGAHESVICKDCHFEKKGEILTQHFTNLTDNCTQCHRDIHMGQFIPKGSGIICLDCHQYNDWKPTQFDHNNTLFPLDGKHRNVDCKKCHKEKIDNNNKFIVYKIKEFKCEDCH